MIIPFDRMRKYTNRILNVRKLQRGSNNTHTVVGPRSLFGPKCMLRSAPTSWRFHEIAHDREVSVKFRHIPEYETRADTRESLVAARKQ